MSTPIVLIPLLAACGTADPVPPPATPAPEPAVESATLTRAQASFAPLPDFVEGAQGTPSKAVVDLGRMLYYEPRLSKNHDLSCNSCHDLARFGVDNEPTSPGHKGVRGERNSPTTLNAALHATQFWDGRAADVEEQAKGPVLNPIEMGMPDGEVVAGVLKSIPGYVDAFSAAFPDSPDPVTYDHLGVAIGAFERGLVTPGPFDLYLAGDASALTDAQVQGLETFMDVGCTACHAGAAVGGTGYFKLGLVEPYETADVGWAGVTDNAAETGAFKPPGLRNITKTGPYLHDGSVAELDEMVRIMGKHQLGKDLTPDQIGQIVAFLDALTGQVDGTYVAKPTLPPSGPETPAPDPT